MPKKLKQEPAIKEFVYQFDIDTESVCRVSINEINVFSQ